MPPLRRVDLDPVVPPDAAFPHRNEVNAKPPEYPTITQGFGSLESLSLNFQAIGRVSWKAASEKDLARGAAQDLIVRRNHLDMAKRIHPVLRRG